MNEILENSNSRFGRAINTLKQKSSFALEGIKGKVNLSTEKEAPPERYELHGTKIEIEYP